jgi:hypothetical protein
MGWHSTRQALSTSVDSAREKHMWGLKSRGLFASLLVALSIAALPTAAQSTPPPVGYADQGWTNTDRNVFYGTSQGSRMMPYAWFKALRRQDVDAPFAGDQLTRYGYLRNDDPTATLPIGFVVDGAGATAQIGMTCAACHTGQLEYQNNGRTFALRLDGAPADVDFQQFLSDLTAASRATLDDAGKFNAFAKAVLGAGATPTAAAQLKSDFAAWVKQFGDFMDASLPKTPAVPWGPKRLDAFGMIFNRVSARDLGVPANFRVADAPVRYPFLWNATKQDHTQWNGGVPNGLYIQGLARNTGEVFGVFAEFTPRVVLYTGPVPWIDYRNNSAHFGGLQTLEEKVATLRPPPWPRDVFPVDDQMAAKGKALFDTHCGTCHAEQQSPTLPRAWNTPVLSVKTDPNMVLNASGTRNPGLYLGASLPPPSVGMYGDPARATDILAGSVIGSLIDEAFSPPITLQEIAQSGVWRALRKDLGDQVSLDTLAALPDLRDVVKTQLSHLYAPPATPGGAAYEARVLHGIWAAAPYLHNGSVPNLWELLKPASQRVTRFSTGSRVFDPKNVGYATDQTPFANGTFVTDPSNTNGNGNGGHEYGTELTEDQRWQIIEYMKTL